MTILIGTVTPEAAWLSQDTVVCLPSDDWERDEGIAAISESESDCQRSAFTGNGAPAAPLILGFTSKLCVLPHLSMIFGAAGERAATLKLFSILSANNLQGDTADLPSQLPEMLRWAVDATEARELVVIGMGWSRKRGRALGFAFASGEDFAGVELVQGQSMMPAIHPECEGYEGIAARWSDADAGKDVERFHELVGRNQVHAYQRGLLRSGAALGGQLTTARISEAGISILPPIDLPGCGALHAKLQRAI